MGILIKKGFDTMLFSWTVDAIALVAFITSYLCYRLKRLGAGDRLLFIAYTFIIAATFAALRVRGAL